MVNLNQPNPFSSSTRISYRLLPTVKQAQLEVFDLVSGKKLQTVSLNTTENEVNLDLSNYQASMYMYRLVADDVIIATKLMTKIK